MNDIARLAVIAALALLCASYAQETVETTAETAPVAAATVAPVEIACRDALSHVGQNVTACGVVAQARYLADFQSKLTFLNMDAAHPQQTMDVVIEDGDRVNFDTPPEELYKGKKLCITGVVEEYRGRAQIKVKNPSQIKVIEEPAAE